MASLDFGDEAGGIVGLCAAHLDGDACGGVGHDGQESVLAHAMCNSRRWLSKA